MLRGALAAAITPLRDGGTALDAAAYGPYADFLASAGLDGILAQGTAGEGILLSREERARATELWLAAAAGRQRSGPRPMRMFEIVEIDPVGRRFATGDRLVRAAHYGDSTIAADGFSGTVRARLQARARLLNGL